MKTTDTLDDFGKLLMQAVRDSTYCQFEAIVTGELKSKSAKLLHAEINKIDPKNLEFLKMIVRDTIDSTLHHFLWMLEQNEEYDLVKYSSNESHPISLREISDGLCGELYTEDGWIEKFSKYPPSIS